MERGEYTIWHAEGKLVFLIAYPAIVEKLLEGEGLAVDLLDDAVGAETCLPGLTVLHHHADHGPSVALDDDDVVQTVGDGDGGDAVVGLEHKLATEGVDDQGTIFEQRGTEVGTAIDGGAVDVAEGEVAPHQSLET